MKTIKTTWDGITLYTTDGFVFFFYINFQLFLILKIFNEKRSEINETLHKTFLIKNFYFFKKLKFDIEEETKILPCPKSI